MAREDEPFIRWRDLPDDLTFFPHEKNFIKTLITHPCARPWYVWVETFVPAFIVLYATVAFFDVEDAIRAHGEKIAGKGTRRKGKRHTPKIRLTGEKTIVRRWSQRGLRTLLLLTGPLEIVGFMWLLYAATDQFFYNWQTLLEKRDFCNRDEQSGPLQLSREGGFISFVVGGVPVILGTQEQNRSSWPHSTIGATLPQGDFAAGFSLTVLAPASGVSNVWIQLKTAGLFGGQTFRSKSLDLGPFEEGSLSVSAHFAYVLSGGGPLSWEIGGNTIPIGIETVKGHMFVHRTN